MWKSIFLLYLNLMSMRGLNTTQYSVLQFTMCGEKQTSSTCKQRFHKDYVFYNQTIYCATCFGVFCKVLITQQIPRKLYILYSKRNCLFITVTFQRGDIQYSVKKKKKNQILKLPCLDSDLINEVSEVAWLVG